MNYEFQASQEVLRRMQEGRSALDRFLAFLMGNKVIIERSYSGPCKIDIHHFNMDNESTRTYVESNPGVMERIVLAENQAFVRVSLYHKEIRIDTYDYRLRRLEQEWKVESIKQAGRP